MSVSYKSAVEVFKSSDESGNARAPDLDEVQAWATVLEGSVGEGTYWFSTLTELEAITPDSGTYPGGVVANDSDVSNNGYYVWTGSSWTRTRGLSASISVLENVDGSANAITAETDNGVDTSYIIAAVLVPEYDNTGSVTLDVDSSGAEDLLGADGADLNAGDLVAGTPALILRSNSVWRLAFSSGSAEIATTAASDAAISASAAASSEANAASSEANAASSESNAASSEANAVTSASSAATSETNAADSASSAATSESNAATSETNAAASATLAQSYADVATGVTPYVLDFDGRTGNITPQVDDYSAFYPRLDMANTFTEDQVITNYWPSLKLQKTDDAGAPEVFGIRADGTRSWYIQLGNLNDDFLIRRFGTDDEIDRTYFQIDSSTGQIILSDHNGSAKFLAGELTLSSGLITDSDIYLNNRCIITNDGDGAEGDRTGDNIDHIWHDDAANAWNFCSDTTYKGTGNSRVNAGSFYASGYEVYHEGNLPDITDADTLDGKHASEFVEDVRLGTSTTYSGDGLYITNQNIAGLSTDNSGSITTVRVRQIQKQIDGTWYTVSMA